jgi:Mg-chelatase subunit ChlD
MQRSSRAAAGLLAGLCSIGALAAQDGYSSAALSRSRYLAEQRRLPSPDEVLVEEFVNFHRHAVPRPKGDAAVALDLRFGGAALCLDDPRAVLQIGLATRLVHDRDNLPPLNLGLVVDKSGSMGAHDKMARVKASLRRMLGQLRPADVVSVVAYDDEARVALPAAPLGDGRRARAAIDSIEPGGATNLHGGLVLGCEEVARCYQPNGTNRVILLTDGIANRGVTDPATIARDAVAWNDRGVDVSTIGVGLEIQKDVLRELAESGRGLYHFIADASDIDKVFERELQGLVAPVARAARLELECDPAFEVERIFGYRPRRDGARWVIDLPDLNLGLTQVVLAELRACGVPARRRVGVTARLRYHDEERRAPASVEAGASLPVRASGAAPLADPEVRKNHTIAVLAQAVRDMAEAWAEGNGRMALSLLHRALGLAWAAYPNIDDADVERVRGIVQDYVAALGPLVARKDV